MGRGRPMGRRFALSLTVGADQQWRWGLASTESAYAGTCQARNREDAVVAVLAEVHADLTVEGSVEVVLTLHASSPLWRLVEEIMGLFDGVRLVAFAEEDTHL